MDSVATSIDTASDGTSIDTNSGSDNSGGRDNAFNPIETGNLPTVETVDVATQTAAPEDCIIKDETLLMDLLE